jgi:hypothetical protein
MERNERINGETWYTSKSAYDGQGLVISEATGRNIAVTYDARDTTLAAAAPELLAALEEAVEYLQAGVDYLLEQDELSNHDGRMDNLIACIEHTQNAIRKAKGE